MTLYQRERERENYIYRKVENVDINARTASAYIGPGLVRRIRYVYFTVAFTDF